jgi:indolepyruvate decarboxylase
VDARILRHPERAAEAVHAVMRAILSEHRPGYLEIHRDMVDVEIPVPRHIVEWDGSFPRPGSDERKLAEAVGDTVQRLRGARRPILIGGVELFREGAERDFLRLAEKLRAPVVTTILAKGVFPMDHALHMGVHIGPFSPPAIQKRVRDADLVLSLGNQLTDMNLGAARPQVRRRHSVWAVNQRVNVSFHTYTDVTLRDFVARLSREKLPRFRERVVYHDNLKHTPRGSGQQPLCINDMLLEVNAFLAQHEGSRYDVFAESGDMLFGGLEVRQRRGGLYFAQGYYASMGFAVPAALGSQIGTGRRPLVLCGDGGFQMTGCEISYAPLRGLSPIVVILNNSGWGIFRPVTPRADLLEIPPWPYAELAQTWGGVGIRARTRAEFAEALRAAHEVKDFVIIECVIDPKDLSPVSRRYIRASARKTAARARGREPR